MATVVKVVAPSAGADESERYTKKKERKKSVFVVIIIIIVVFEKKRNHANTVSSKGERFNSLSAMSLKW